MVDLTRETGRMLSENFHHDDSEPSLKADHSLVTQADREADELILHAIQERFPGETIISEELNPQLKDGESLDDLETIWVVDPLDGTTNFSLGLHYWGTLIARIERGWPAEAVMYFPLLDELFSAQKGQRALLNGQQIHVEPPDPRRPVSFFACCSRTFRNYEVSLPYKARILGSAAYSLSAVARGVALLAFEATPKIWDIAAPWLLVQEAGGIIWTLDGSQPFPLNEGTDYSRQSYPTLAAATQKLAQKARRSITPKK
jgi:myo-inositol-1(or 4)-monophosphatase